MKELVELEMKKQIDEEELKVVPNPTLHEEKPKQ